MVTLVKTNDVYNVVVNYYEADSSADLANIDVSALNMGCKVHVIDEDKYYLLNGSGEWSEVTEGGGGSGTGTLINKTINENGVYVATDDSADGYKKVEVNIPSLSLNDVTFYDYDGSIVASYSSSEFLDLSEMPANPSHEGLISIGWNWPLLDAKNYVAEYGELDIGQIYKTDDGKTRIYITIGNSLSDYNLTVNMRFRQTVTKGVIVDWGDGSSPLTYTGTTMKDHEHVYSSPGDYVITFAISYGAELYFGGENSTYAIYGNYTNNNCYLYAGRIKKVEIGDRTYIREYAFYQCYNLETVILCGNGYDDLPSNCFRQCSSLKHFTFIKSLNNLNNYSNMFYQCYNLKSVCFAGNFNGEVSPNYKINYNFSECRNLQRITIPRTTYIPENFIERTNIKHIKIPQSVEEIGKSAFRGNQSLESELTIPATTTSIGNYAFYELYSVEKYHFLGTTPPVLGANVFGSTPYRDLLGVIYVPRSENEEVLTAYKTASNWSNYADYIQEEPE